MKMFNIFSLPIVLFSLPMLCKRVYTSCVCAMQLSINLISINNFMTLHDYNNNCYIYMYFNKSLASP